MKGLLKKLNYKDSKRIALVNTDESFFRSISEELGNVIIDREVDQRCPYEFMIFFTPSSREVEHFAPIAVHNLTADGILWFCYPKKTSKKFTSDLDRDHGWKPLNSTGFHVIRLVSVDNDWSAMRFRNIKYIKSKSERPVKQ